MARSIAVSGRLLPGAQAKENLQEFHENVQRWDGTCSQVCSKGQESDVLSPPRRRREDTPERIFEARVCDGRQDAVHAWCEYVQWTAENRRSEDELSVLARACSALAEDAKHKDDIRHLRLWVRYAAHLSDPEKVFDFLAAEGIGLQHALLYEARAAQLERNRKFPEAERQYQLGLQREAEPQERLRSRYQEFQRRMCKRAARKGPKPPTQQEQTGEDLSQMKHDLPSAPAVPVKSAAGVADTFAVHEDTALQIGADEAELPVDQIFIPVPSRTLLEPELPARQSLVPAGPSCIEAEAAAPRVLVRIGGTAEWNASRSGGPPGRSSKASECRRESRASLQSLHSGTNATSELTTGLRSLLAGPVRRSSCGGFEDPTYTSELAQREILALFAGDREAAVAPVAPVGTHRMPLRHGSHRSETSPRTSGAFEIFEETDFSVGRR